MSENELDKILREIREKNGADNFGLLEERPKSSKPDSEPEHTSYFDIDIDEILGIEKKKEGANIDIPLDEVAPVIDDADEAPMESMLPEIEPPKEKTEFTMDSVDLDVLEGEPDDKPKKKNKGIIIAVIAVVVAIAIGVGVYFGFFHNKNEEMAPTTTTTTTTTTEKVRGPLNPLTGEEGFDESALTQRPVAVVVENEYSTASVKPQWGISSADIVLEGESEFSTRMLMFWADYNNMPDQIGPTRSARPPFIHFSQLFDAIFIHAGLSHSGGGYVGADDVFVNENIDHINLLNYSEESGFFKRDYSRTNTVEHTGVLLGKNVPKLLESKGLRTELNTDRFTALSFNEEAKSLSNMTANNVTFKWSLNCPKKAKLFYDQDSHKYSTTDFDSQFGEANVQWENVLLLLDATQYYVKENYKGSGNSETYCDYQLAGGKGVLCSEGTFVEVSWGVENGKLWMKDIDGKAVSLNPGKTYIGYGSANHGGEYTLE